MPVLFRTTGTVSGPRFALQPRNRLTHPFGRVRMPVTCAIVERPDGLVLIDTGWSRAQCAFPHEDPGLVAQLALGLEVRAEDSLASQLISLGYEPGDVKHIVATHLHRDHIGGAVDFPKAAIHASPLEWEARLRGAHRGYDPRLSSMADRIRLHTFDPVPQLGFERSHDLFGDGTVFMLDAAGHTAGSTAVALKLVDGWCIHAGDACMFVEQLEDANVDSFSLYARATSHDRKKQRATFSALQRSQREFGAKVIPSHDPTVYEKLPTTKEAAWRASWDPAGKNKGKHRAPPPA
jgi:glyoxylase-like metal-dependent hydrolase (beta-lactamase superfamily II)